MDAGLPGVEFETHGRIASAVARKGGNRASSGQKQRISAFLARFLQLGRVKSDRLLATPLDFQPAADGNYYLFGADIEALSQLPAYAKLPIDTNGETQYGNGLELGDKHISIAFSNLSSLQNIAKLVNSCGAFDMRHSVVRSHILGLMLLEISGEIYTDLGKDVANILNKWKNHGRKGMLGTMKDLLDIDHDDLA
jgi:hypothetical protein